MKLSTCCWFGLLGVAVLLELGYGSEAVIARCFECALLGLGGGRWYSQSCDCVAGWFCWVGGEGGAAIELCTCDVIFCFLVGPVCCV